MLEDRTSRIALAVSLLVHAALAAPLWDRLGLAAADAPAPVVEREPLAFRFVEAPEAPEEEPEEPTRNLSTVDQRAAQPEAPDVPRGAAYSAGSVPAPTTPRPVGWPEPAGARPARATPERAAPDAERRATTERAAEAGTRAAGTVDPRLAIPREPIRARPGVPDAGSRLPAPEVDQRLTRAAAGSSFRLNTTAWEYGPYLARLKRAIEEEIAPPAAFYYGVAAWATSVRFRIEPDGRLSGLQLLDHAGVPNLQYVSTDAIRRAADFEPLPPGFPEPYLEITGNFYFNVRPDEE